MAHPNKHIREAIEYAIGRRWRFAKAGPRAHVYGELFCPHGAGGCIVRVFSTPANAQSHAKRIVQKVNKCVHS